MKLINDASYTTVDGRRKSCPRTKSPSTVNLRMFMLPQTLASSDGERVPQQIVSSQPSKMWRYSVDGLALRLPALLGGLGDMVRIIADHRAARCVRLVVEARRLVLPEQDDVRGVSAIRHR